MKNKINNLGFAVILILLILYSCEDEPNEISLIKTTDNYIPDETQPSPSGLGKRIYDFPGGGRKYAVSFSIGTKVYLGFGFIQGGQAVDFWEWDYNEAYTDSDLVTKNLWKKLPDFPGSVCKNGATEGTPYGFAVNGKCFISPGAFLDNGKLVNEFWEFDPETNLWAQKANPPVSLARGSVTGFSLGSKMYVGTGETYYEGKLEQYRDFWEWDQITDTWTKKHDAPGAARTHAIGFTIGNKGYIGMGGESGMGGGPLYYDFWEYNPATDNWSQKANFPGTQQMDAVAFSIGNKGYVTAGWDRMSESPSSQDIWEWDQTTNTWSKIGIFKGDPRIGAVGGTIGNRGYLLSGESLTSLSALNDFWIFDFISN